MYYGAGRGRVMPDYDYGLIWGFLLTIGLGVVMVYSASIAIAEASKLTGHNQAYFLVRQLVFVAIGLLTGFVAFQVRSAELQNAAPYLFMLGTALLLLVLVPGIGKEVNGSQRWLALPGFNIQPSELMKLFVVLYAADYTVRKASHMDSFRHGFLPMLMVMLLVGGLLLREPDFGAFAVITAITMATLFLGGVNWRLFAGLIVMLVIGFLLLIWTSPYRLKRVVGFMNPWEDPFGKGYQLSHALIAFGRGEWFGVGLGGSVEKLFYLPEAHTDFLLAVIAEELGFVGVAAVVGLFAYIVVKCFMVGRQAIRQERPFAALTAMGIGVWLGVQAGINMGVNVGLLPTKGLTLPLMSFGGSGIIANCIAAGIVLRIDWENRQIMKGLSV